MESIQYLKRMARGAALGALVGFAFSGGTALNAESDGNNASRLAKVDFVAKDTIARVALSNEASQDYSTADTFGILSGGMGIIALGLGAYGLMPPARVREPEQVAENR